MKITAVITDADIRWHIDQAATELEEDNQIRFPDSTARAEFTNCTNATPSATVRITGSRSSTWLTCTNTRSAINTCVFP